MEDDNEESRWEKVEEIIDGSKYDMRKMKKKIKTLEEQMEEHTRKSNAGESLRSVNDNLQGSRIKIYLARGRRDSDC
jgi:DNA-binding protein YbaB